jgi:CubicO group peptidase (beta-lactamase class C family)
VVVITAIVRNGTLYYSDAATPYGPYPYPLEMRFGPRSILKSVGVPLALLRLAEVYGPFVLDLKFAEYVLVADPKYRRVRFIDAADMATGMGGAGSLKTNPNDTEDGYVDAHYDAWYLAPSKADKMREIDAHNVPYPWEPGTVMRYRDHDFYLLGAALEGFLKSVKGADADLWDMLRNEVLEPIGVHHAPIVRTREPDGKPGLAWLSAGYYPTLDDLAKIATLYEDGGAHGGRQILDPKLTAAIFSTENTIRQNTDMALTVACRRKTTSRSCSPKWAFALLSVCERGAPASGSTCRRCRDRAATSSRCIQNHVIAMRLAKAWPMPMKTN